MSTPTVSVIIPNYNGESVIDGAIESALDQSYKNIEIIVVDDGSTDLSLEVAKTYEPAISVISQRNRGACHARNTGLHESGGEFVNFLDSDDILWRNKIEHQVALAKAKKVDLIVSSFSVLRTNGEIGAYGVLNDPWEGLIRSRFGITSANLWRSEKVVEVGGWDNDWDSGQEYELMFRLLKADASIAIDHKPQTLIRRQESSIYNPNSADVIERQIQLRKRIENYLQESDQLTEDRHRHIYSVLFYRLKQLALIDRERAEKLVEMHFPPHFTPSDYYPVNERYDFVFKHFGCYYAERIRPFVGRFISY